MEDALTVVKALGERYLWIDLFCIDQTDTHELESQIKQMNMIYQCATLTIVARDAEDASAGIAGISRPMNLRAQPLCRLSDGELMATAFHRAVANAGKSPWDSRAWTMCEWLFSYRVLSFTNHSLRMICEKEYFADMIVTETGPERRPIPVISKDEWDDVLALGLRISKWDFNIYDSLISLYTMRLLKYPFDILNACQGALSELYTRTGVSFQQGLPVSDIHRALLWSPHRQHTLTRRPDFPSWSWCGWFGRIEYRQWVIDLTDLDAQSQDTNDLTVINEKSKKRRLGKSALTTNLASRTIARITILSTSALHISSRMAPCTLAKRRTDRRTPTLLTIFDPEVGTLVKKDLGYLYTILSLGGRPMVDIANNAEEVDVFDETNHFLRLSKEQADLVDEVSAKVDLVQIHDLPLVRDSKEHDWYLADMVSCLVVVKNAAEGTRERIGALLLERDVFESFKPKAAMIEIT